ncbi:hypothetical protein D9M69_433600 [compost metagenome]
MNKSIPTWREEYKAGGALFSPEKYMQDEIDNLRHRLSLREQMISEDTQRLDALVAKLKAAEAEIERLNETIEGMNQAHWKLVQEYKALDAKQNGEPK